jgi:LuxR family maltose regulon positive regulatory protein
MNGHDGVLVQTKLHAPRRRPGVLRRSRLDERLAPAAVPPVVLVSAPAGFGKTTLLAQWATEAEDSGLRTAWLSLDRRDSDPVVFWSYVIAALRKIDEELGTAALGTLQSAPGGVDAVIGALLNDLAARDDTVLVLDDYHAIESVDVHESMRFFVDHLPPTVHLVVATRADPPWPLASLRARGDLLEIRAADPASRRARRRRT